MRNRIVAKAAELRWKAEQWRRYATETNQCTYIELMAGAANDLECEADKLERRARFGGEILPLAS